MADDWMSSIPGLDPSLVSGLGALADPFASDISTEMTQTPMAGADTSTSISTTVSNLLTSSGDLKWTAVPLILSLVAELGIGPAALALGIAIPVMATLYAHATQKKQSRGRRRRGISGRQLQNAKRVNRMIASMYHSLMQSCPRPRRSSSGGGNVFPFRRKKRQAA